MGKKIRIGIIWGDFTYWPGGEYYLRSILSCLLAIEGAYEIHILCSTKKKFNLVEKMFPEHKLHYMRYEFTRLWRLLSQLVSRFGQLEKPSLLLNSPRLDGLLRKLDYIFPCELDIRLRNVASRKKVFWIPDFQENHLPRLFEMSELIARATAQVRIAYSESNLVLSSFSALEDFARLFPKNAVRTYVLRFVSSAMKKLRDHESVMDQYDVRTPYFICSNQFWTHKNHKVVLEAIEEVSKKSDLKFCVVFTGHKFDLREKDNKYFPSLQYVVKQKQIEEHVKFVGFIPRVDQLTLLDGAIALIQPSLFEGWNTSIEDAKKFGRRIIASDLPVHREQLGEDGAYFDPYSAVELAAQMLGLITNSQDTVDYHYNDKEALFRSELTRIFSDPGSTTPSKASS